MSVQEDELRRVASLARLRLEGDRLHALAAQVTAILEHVAVLQSVDTAGVAPMSTTPTADNPLRADEGAPLAPSLGVERERFAPSWREGFFLVPRLESHEGEPAADA